MSQDLYSQGYSQYMSAPQPDNVVKGQPPQWRAGYRAAQKTKEAKSKIAIKAEKVDKVQYGNLEITWSLVCFVTNTNRFEVLTRIKELYPILSLIRNSLYNNRESINGYKDLFVQANRLYDTVLQYGYEQGTLTKEDCLSNGYSPK